MRSSILLLLGCLFHLHAGAAELFATVDAVNGDAYVVNAAGKSAVIVSGQKIYEGETIGTRTNSELHLVTADGGFLAIRPDSTLRVDAYKASQSADAKIHMSLLKGALRSISGWISRFNQDGYRLRTTTATIGIRGTDHETMELDQPTDGQAPGVYHRVLEGSTVLVNEHGSQEVKAGEFAHALRAAGSAPRLLTTSPPFMVNRVLRIEARIAERREALRNSNERMLDGKSRAGPEGMREGGREGFREGMRDGLRDMTPDQRERMRQRAMQRLPNRH